ncbi:hypothetical protein ACR79T_16390 [Sphingobacterium spiritivorum]|uniref:hypothetical protein n=1 Tax=Sphingobacterium spiritivorum TaxID=258 RepID=UPI003DA3683A
MKLEDLKYNNRQNSPTSSSTLLFLPEEAIEKLTTQKPTNLLDTIDENLKKNIRYRSLFILVAIGILLYNYDNTFWGWYFTLGSVVEAGMTCIAYKLRKKIHESFETDLPITDRFIQIQGLIQNYLKFNKIARGSILVILVIAVSLKNTQSFDLPSLFSGDVILRFFILGLIFYFIHTYSFKKFAKPHQDMLVDLHYYLKELEDLPQEGIQTQTQKNVGE